MNNQRIRFGKNIGKPQCQELVSDGARSMRFHQHDAVAVKDGKCRFHLSVEARRLERRQAWETKSKNAELAELKSSAQAKRLSKVLGVEVKPYWFLSGFTIIYTGEMVVPADFLEAAAEDLEERNSG